MKWYEIMDKMHYSESGLHIKHNQALKEIDKILKSVE